MTPAMRTLLALISLVLLAVGCGGKDRYVTVTEVFDVAPPAERWPMTVGVYFSPRFANFVAVDAYEVESTDYRVHVAIGQPSVALFAEVLPRMFARTVLLENGPPLWLERPDLDFMIEPRIDKAVYLRRVPRARDDLDDPIVNEGVYLAETRYALTLYSPEGEVLGDYAVSGKAQGFDGLHGYPVVSRTMKQTMERAVTKLAAEFPRQPAVQDWLRRRGLASAAAPAN